MVVINVPNEWLHKGLICQSIQIIHQFDCHVDPTTTFTAYHLGDIYSFIYCHFSCYTFSALSAERVENLHAHGILLMNLFIYYYLCCCRDHVILHSLSMCIKVLSGSYTQQLFFKQDGLKVQGRTVRDLLLYALLNRSCHTLLHGLSMCIRIQYPKNVSIKKELMFKGNLAGALRKP